MMYFVSALLTVVAVVLTTSTGFGLSDSKTFSSYHQEVMMNFNYERFTIAVAVKRRLPLHSSMFATRRAQKTLVD
jgi:outer membrane lipopolysaccharide assembly protein LptE/RlpB